MDLPADSIYFRSWSGGISSVMMIAWIWEISVEFNQAFALLFSKNVQWRWSLKNSFFNALYYLIVSEYVMNGAKRMDLADSGKLLV